MKHLFIINPAAGKGLALEYVSRIEKLFERIGEEYTIKITEKPGHATEIAREFSEKETYRIYAVGGDGTLNEVLNGIVGSDSSLGVIPAGSGDDFIRSVNPMNHEKNILERTVMGKEKFIDLAKVNDRYFVNIASIGIDAEIAYNAVKFKKLPFVPSRLSYLLSIFVTVFKYKSRVVKVKLDSLTFTSNTLLLASANGRYYGGGMLIAPEAELDDGSFDICHVRDIGIIRILALFPKLIRGEHKGIKEVSFYKSSRLELNSESELTLNIDGEFFKTKRLEFRIIPKGIKIIVPENKSMGEFK